MTLIAGILLNFLMIYYFLHYFTYDVFLNSLFFQQSLLPTRYVLIFLKKCKQQIKIFNIYHQNTFGNSNTNILLFII